jgi:tetratricopeptide (TPR) repeat protein
MTTTDIAFIDRARRLAGLACAVLVCGLLGWGAFYVALGDALGARKPEAAFELDPRRAALAVAFADRALGNEEPEEIARAQDMLREALRVNPLAPRLVTALALVEDSRARGERARALMRAAGDAFVRDEAAQAWLFEDSLKAGDYAAAVRRLDHALRVAPGRVDATLRGLLPFVGVEPAAAPLAEVLAQAPPWREQALILFARRADVGFLWSLHQKLKASAAPAEPEELRAYLERLVEERMFEDAYAVWAETLPADRLARAGPLYNSRFQYPVTNTPFDWTITEAPGRVTRVVGEPGRRRLQVDFFGGRVPYRDVRHMMMLSPGDYRFVGLERAMNLRTERGLKWRIVCAMDGETLGETGLLAGEVAWRPFVVEFTVPEGCIAQTLQLELAARVALEQVVSGGAAYGGLVVEPRPAASATAGDDADQALQNLN